MSRHFLTRWVSRLLGLARLSWEYTVRVGAHRLSPFAFHIISVFFPFTLNMALDFIRASSLGLRKMYLHLFDLGLALVAYPMLLSQMRSLGCAWSRNLGSNFCPDRGLNLGPRSLMAAKVTTRLQRTLSFSRLLQEDIQRDNSNPEWAGVIPYKANGEKQISHIKYIHVPGQERLLYIYISRLGHFVKTLFW